MKAIHNPFDRAATRDFFRLGSIAVSLALPAVQAAPYTWTKNAAGTQTWATAANWSGSTAFVSGATNELVFFSDTTTALVNGSNTITTSVPALTMNALTLNGRGAAATGASNIIIGTNATTWTLDGTTPIVNLNGVNGTHPLNYTVAINLALAQSNTTFTGAGTASFNFTGVISGVGSGITKSGSSSLTLSGANTFDGGVTLSAGNLFINNPGTSGTNSAIGTGTFTINGGTIQNSNTVTLATNNTLVLGGNFTAVGASALNLGTGNVTMAATRTITTTHGGGLTIGGNIQTTSAGLTKAGNGSLFLNGTNDYTGVTTVSAGTLSFGSKGSLYNGGSASWTSANLIAASGATLAFGVGSSPSYFTASDLDIIKATTGIASGAKIGIDTTNSGGSFTYGGVFNPGVGLAKLGTGTLSYTPAVAGPLAVDNGTLTLGADSPDVTPLTFGVAPGSRNFGTLDLSSSSLTATSLTVQNNHATANTLTVGSGRTLTVNGAVTVGADTSPFLNSITGLTASGAGAMAINDATKNLLVGQAQGSNSFSNTTTFDASGLGAFTATVKDLGVGYGTTTTGYFLLSNGANTITANNVYVGGNSNSGNATNLTSTLTLGAGTNVIATDVFNIGISKALGSVKFASQTAGSPGSVTIGGKTGTKTHFIIGSNMPYAGNSGNSPTGTLDFRGHVANVTAGTILIGQRTELTANTATSGANGTLYFDGGSLTVDALTVGLRDGTTTLSTAVATGAIHLSGGDFTVNSGGSFRLATVTGSTTGSANGLLNLTGGTFTSNVPITTSTSSSSTPATGAVITLNGGTLDLAGNSVGATGAGNTITFNAQAGTLKNLGELNRGGSLTKTTSGVLTVGGANTYTGVTIINAGTLALSGGNNRLLATGTVAFDGANSSATTFDIGSNSQTLSTLTFPSTGLTTGTTANITGSGGSLVINGASDLNLGPTYASGTPGTTVNMSGLSNFTYDSSGKNFNVQIFGNTAGSNSATLASAVTLATGSNSITASQVNVGQNGGASGGGASTLTLGTANTLKTGIISIGYNSRSTATLEFAAGLTAPTLSVRNTDGTSATSSWNVGKISDNNTSRTWTDSVDLTAGTLDAWVGTINLGNADTAALTGRMGTLNAAFTVGATTGKHLTVTHLNLGLIQGSSATGVANSGTLAANGTFTLASATGIVNATTITFATNTIADTGTGTKNVSGTFNLIDGTLNATTLSKGVQTGTATSATAAVNWSAGTIANLSGGNLAITGVPIKLLTSAGHTFAISGSGTATLDAASPISGTDFGITKSGSGTLSLSATNTYTGATTVSGGSLVVGVGGVGSITSAVTATTSGAMLAGSGTVTGAVTIHNGAILAPGNSPGTLTVAGTTTLDSGSIFSWELASDVDHDGIDAEGTRGTDYDGLNTTNLTVASGAIFRVVLSGSASVETAFWHQTRTWNNIFSVSETTSNAVTGHLFETFQVYSGGSDITSATSATRGHFTMTGSSLTWSAVPEPTSALAGLFLGAGLLRRRRN